MPNILKNREMRRLEGTNLPNHSILAIFEALKIGIAAEGDARVR